MTPRLGGFLASIRLHAVLAPMSSAVSRSRH